MGIEWQEGAVCFSMGKQRKFINNKCLYLSVNLGWIPSSVAMHESVKHCDFQLNTIKKGDCIPKSELNTEDKYNRAVEVFGLFGFRRNSQYALNYKDFMNHGGEDRLIAMQGLLITTNQASSSSKRKITFNQLMAIGELKRLEIESDKSAPKIAPDLTPDLENNQESKVQKNKPVVAQVMIDLTERMEIGIKTYGEALRANNGRDALQDAYEEALDLACYLKQAMIERDNKEVK